MRTLGKYLILAAGAALAFSGCTTGPENPSGAEIRFHNWWNFYERGLTLMNRRDFTNARGDFVTALGIEPGAKFGNDHDAWRARTYGLHFVEGYFPNREAGICFYHLGDNARAAKYLETSLKQAPSSRAKYYLNLVNQSVFVHRSVSVPSFEIEDACKTRWTKERRRVVAGSVHAEGLVKDVSCNGKPLFIELAENRLPFSEEIVLHEGANRITVTASDLKNQRSETGLVWQADWTPPHAIIQRVSQDADGLVVQGACIDDQALEEAWVNGQFLSGGSELAMPFSVHVSAGAPILVSAQDRAGNKFIRSLSTTDTACHDTWRFADASPGGRSDAGNSSPGTPTNEDRLRPSLDLPAAGQTLDVYDEEYFMDGTCADGGGLASIRVNGEELLGTESRGAIKSYFSRRLPLDIGTNRFDVVVRDDAGNETRKSISLVRRQPDYLDEQYRLTVSVTPLPGEYGVIYNLMSAEITLAPPRFHVLERNEGWDFILREQNLSLSDLADPAAALRIGKMLPAEILFMGAILKQDKGLTVFVKAVETSNGRMLFSNDVYTENPDRDLDYQVAGLIMKIKQQFPLTAGKIVTASDDEIRVNVGSRQGVRSGTTFVVVAPGPEGSPGAGQVRKMDDQPVVLDVGRVAADYGIAAVRPAKAKVQLRPGDLIYAR